MNKILIATIKPFSAEPRDECVKIMQDAGLDVTILEKYKDSQELKDNLKGMHGLIVRSDKITNDVIDAANDLELIVRGGAGTDSIASDYAKLKNIIVENTPGQNSDAVAELTIELMALSARPLNGKTGTQLKGKKLGIHGFGNIGQRVAKIADAYGMDIYTYSMELDKQKAVEYHVTIVDNLEELYENADYISLHIPKTKDTIESVDYKLMNLMKEDGKLINTARAEIIKESDLLRIMQDNEEFKYGSDVMPTQQTKDELDNKYSKRTILTPKKQGAQTHESNFNTAIAAANQIVEYFNNKKVINQINK